MGASGVGSHERGTKGGIDGLVVAFHVRIQYESSISE
jgi:hypothetical protein